MSNVKLPQLDTTPLERSAAEQIPSAIARPFVLKLLCRERQLFAALQRINQLEAEAVKRRDAKGEEVMNNVFDPDMVERMIFPNLTVVSVDDYDELRHIYNETRQHIRKLLERIAHLEASLAKTDLVFIGTLRRELFMAYTCKWNGYVRDITAELEVDDAIVSRQAVNERICKDAAALMTKMEMVRESLANQNSKEERLLAVGEKLAERL